MNNIYIDGVSLFILISFSSLIAFLYEMEHLYLRMIQLR